MKMKSFYTAMAAVSMMVASTASAAVSTPLTQKAVAPASETVSGDNAGIGKGTGFIVLILAIGAIGLGIWAAVDADSSPNSP